MTRNRRGPRPLATALAGSREQWQPGTPLSNAQSAWDAVARAWADALGAQGAYILARAQPVSLRAGVLTVSCTESGVAEAVELESASLIARLNAQMSSDPVSRLHCITGGRGARAV